MTSPSCCYVHRITTALPRQALEQAQAEERLPGTCRNRRSEKLLQRINRLTGIKKRHLAILDFQSTLHDQKGIYRPSIEQPEGPGMAARTAMFDQAAGPLVQRLLKDFPPESLTNIDTLVTVSCTHASSPGLEQPVFAHSTVPVGVQRWNLGFMGCSAALAAIRLIHRARAETREALIVACELSSLHFQYTDEIDQMTANLLFADGAAAMIMSARPAAVRVIDCACRTLPQAAEQMVWFAGDHGLQLRLSPLLPETLGRVIPEVVGSFLARNSLSVADVGHWLVHPGGPQILDSTQDALHLPSGAIDLSRSILTEYGNMSSPTILFILKELMERKENGLALAIAFGPGLTIETVLFELRYGSM